MKILLALLLFFAQNQGPMDNGATASGSAPPSPPSVVNSAYHTPSSGSTTSVASTAISVSAGNLIFACTAITASSTTFTITDTGNANTFTSLTQRSRGSGYLGQCFYAKNTVAVSGDIITSHSTTSGTFQDLLVVQVSGADTVSPLDQDIGGSGSSTGTIATTAFTTTAANEIILAAGPFNGTAGGYSPGSGYTSAVDDTFETLMEYKQVSSIQTSVTATMSVGFNGVWLLEGATFKAP